VVGGDSRLCSLVQALLRLHKLAVVLFGVESDVDTLVQSVFNHALRCLQSFGVLDGGLVGHSNALGCLGIFLLEESVGVLNDFIKVTVLLFGFARDERGVEGAVRGIFLLLKGLGAGQHALLDHGAEEISEVLAQNTRVLFEVLSDLFFMLHFGDVGRPDEHGVVRVRVFTVLVDQLEVGLSEVLGKFGVGTSESNFGVFHGVFLARSILSNYLSELIVLHLEVLELAKRRFTNGTKH